MPMRNVEWNQGHGGGPVELPLMAAMATQGCPPAWWSRSPLTSVVFGRHVVADRERRYSFVLRRSLDDFPCIGFVVPKKRFSMRRAHQLNLEPEARAQGFGAAHRSRTLNSHRRRVDLTWNRSNAVDRIRWFTSVQKGLNDDVHGISSLGLSKTLVVFEACCCCLGRSGHTSALEVE